MENGQSDRSCTAASRDDDGSQSSSLPEAIDDDGHEPNIIPRERKGKSKERIRKRKGTGKRKEHKQRHETESSSTTQAQGGRRPIALGVLSGGKTKVAETVGTTSVSQLNALCEEHNSIRIAESDGIDELAKLPDRSLPRNVQEIINSKLSADLVQESKLELQPRRPEVCPLGVTGVGVSASHISPIPFHLDFPEVNFPELSDRTSHEPKEKCPDIGLERFPPELPDRTSPIYKDKPNEQNVPDERWKVYNGLDIGPKVFPAELPDRTSPVYKNKPKEQSGRKETGKVYKGLDISPEMFPAELPDRMSPAYKDNPNEQDGRQDTGKVYKGLDIGPEMFPAELPDRTSPAHKGNHKEQKCRKETGKVYRGLDIGPEVFPAELPDRTSPVYINKPNGRNGHADFDPPLDSNERAATEEENERLDLFHPRGVSEGHLEHATGAEPLSGMTFPEVAPEFRRPGAEYVSGRVALLPHDTDGRAHLLGQLQRDSMQLVSASLVQALPEAEVIIDTEPKPSPERRTQKLLWAGGLCSLVLGVVVVVAVMLSLPDPPTIGPTYESTTEPPSSMPTIVPSNMPTIVPSNMPTIVPSNTPTIVPSNMPTTVPSNMPTAEPPSNMPTAEPPSNEPTIVSRSNVPTIVPSSSMPIPRNVTIAPSSDMSTIAPTVSVVTSAPTSAPTGFVSTSAPTMAAMNSTETIAPT